MRAAGQGVSSRSVAAVPRPKPSGLPFGSRFTDIAAAAGLRDPVIYGEEDRKDYIFETVGCGVAFIDYDNDGWPDLFVLSGTLMGSPEKSATNRLYHNNRNGTFTDVTRSAKLERTGWASAVCVGDYDNDGFDDLFITYWGQNVLYHNNGDGTFTDVTEKAGLIYPKTRWGSGCTFIEARRNGLLDLVVATYVDFDLLKLPKPGSDNTCNWKGVPVNCGPQGLPPGRLFFYRNNGDGSFTDVSDAAGVSKAAGSYCMTTVAADFSNNGWQDIFVACDSSSSFLLRNNKNGTFTDVGLESGTALNQDGMPQAGMGVGVGDYNLDGRLDIFKTHFADDTNILYKNGGEFRFDDVTISGGLGVETRFVSWGTGITDLDNDGFPEILFVTGNIYPEVERVLRAYPFKTPRVIFRNLGNGKFEELVDEAGPGIAARHASRGCAFGDFDNDGDVDVAIVNLGEPPSLLRNDVSRAGHWIKVKLAGVQSNRSAIGALVVARYGGRLQAQTVMSQSSFYSVNDLRLHFGLGAAEAADLDIHWPSGAIESVSNVQAGNLATIREGHGIVRQKPLCDCLPRTR